MLSSGLAVLLIAVAALAAQAVPLSGGEPQKVCHLHWGLESPCFDLVKKAEGYEIRKYSAGEWWSSTTVAGPQDWQAQTKEGFMRNFKYISGGNAEGEKIPMATPVATSRVGDSLTVSFFMTTAFPVPPAPNNSTGVSMKHTTADRYFAVVQFGGYASGDDLDTRGGKLKEALGKDGVAVLDKRTWLAQYDPPFVPFFRHNEVWVPVAPPAEEAAADSK